MDIDTKHAELILQGKITTFAPQQFPLLNIIRMGEQEIMKDLPATRAHVTILGRSTGTIFRTTANCKENGKT